VFSVGDDDWAAAAAAAAAASASALRAQAFIFGTFAGDEHPPGTLIFRSCFAKPSTQTLAINPSYLYPDLMIQLQA
jgi:hypothetical protein